MVDGRITSDPRQVAMQHGGALHDLWKGVSGDCRPDIGIGDLDQWSRPLPRLTPDQLRAASHRYSLLTSETYDGFHPRHYGLLCDEALEGLADFYTLAEEAAAFPEQLALLPFPMLRKPRGGWRAVCIFPLPYRLWTRARSHLFRGWEEAHARPFFACGKGRSAESTVWRQSLKAEAAVAAGEDAASVLLDGHKFFKMFVLSVLYRRAIEAGLDATAVRICINVFRGPRCVIFGSIALRPVFATVGLPVGCASSTTFVKAYTLAPIRRLRGQAPQDRLPGLH